jgi:phosphoglycerate dehydrogenase-like enzyme
MSADGTPVKIAVLDDYQGVALTMADWSILQGRTEITVFNDHVSSEDEVIERLRPFEVICVMRERTPLNRRVISSLPNLELIVSTGMANAAIDSDAASEHAVEVRFTRYSSAPTIEYTWALLLAAARNLPQETQSVRNGGWQVAVGEDLEGNTLGLLGLGRVGSGVAKVGLAFGMNVVAWSQNLTADAAHAQGVSLVSKEGLLSSSDFLSIHTRLSSRTAGLIGEKELALMKPTAWLINTSRGPIVEEKALVAALKASRIAGAAIDVYDIEPLGHDHPFRTLPNVVATPHIGYVSKRLYSVFYGDTVLAIATWLDARAAS